MPLRSYIEAIIYRGYRPTYRIICLLYYIYFIVRCECAADKPFTKIMPFFAQKSIYYLYLNSFLIFSSYGCTITLPYVPYRIMPLIEVLCLHVCFSYLTTRQHMFMIEDPVRGLCLYTHSVAECWLCLAISNVCSFVGAPPVCVSIDCMCVCVCTEHIGILFILTDIQTFSIYTRVVLIGLDWSAYKG